MRCSCGSPSSRRAAWPCSSRTASPRCGWPTASWYCRGASWWTRGLTRSWWREAGCTPSCSRSRRRGTAEPPGERPDRRLSLRAREGASMRTVALMVLSLSVATLAGRSPLAAQRRSNVLTAEEIQRANVGSAYDAVQTLRPRWLQGPKELNRMPANAEEAARPAGIAGYVNDLSIGGVDYLREIPAGTVLELRGLSSFAAASRFGPTEGQSAIVVTLKRGG